MIQRRRGNTMVSTGSSVRRLLIARGFGGGRVQLGILGTLLGSSAFGVWLSNIFGGSTALFDGRLGV